MGVTKHLYFHYQDFLQSVVIPGQEVCSVLLFFSPPPFPSSLPFLSLSLSGQGLTVQPTLASNS